MAVMQRPSPVALALAAVAREGGAVRATLIQRFGTKRSLLLAACRTAPGGVPEQFGAAHAKYGSPLKTLIELYAECGGFRFAPETHAQGPAHPPGDLIDPPFYPLPPAPITPHPPQTQKILPRAL